jgi:L-tyrosine C(3)-methyltransferase
MENNENKLDFYLVLGGAFYFQYLYCGCRFGVFDYIEENPENNIQSISKGIGLSEQSTRVLLLGLCAAELLKKNNNSYVNSTLARKRLRKSVDGNIIPTIDFYHKVVYPALFKLEDSLLESTNKGLEVVPGTSGTLYERIDSIPELKELFHRWMRVYSKVGLSVGSQQVLSQIGPTLSSIQSLADVCGGVGHNAIDLCRTFPELSVTVYDLPAVCEAGRQNVKNAGLENRIKFVEGNVFETNIPNKHDTVMFSHIMEIYSQKENTLLMKKAYEALPEKGFLILFSPVSNDEETGPHVAAFMSAYFLGLASGTGMVHSLKSLESWASEVGFTTKIKSILGNDHHGVYIGQK